MAGLKDYTGIIIAILVAVVVVYLIDPTFFGLMKSVSGFKGSRSKSGFEDMMKKEEEKKPEVPMAGGDANVGMNTAGEVQLKDNVGQEHVAPAVPTEGFSDMAGAADFSSSPAPAGCYAREQINPGELLPKESGVWAEQNPSGPGSLKGKNFLSAGALIGVNTIGQSLKNASWDLRSEPACPQVPVSIFNNSTYQPDLLRRPLEIQ